MDHGNCCVFLYITEIQQSSAKPCAQSGSSYPLLPDASLKSQTQPLPRDCAFASIFPFSGILFSFFSISFHLFTSFLAFVFALWGWWKIGFLPDSRTPHVFADDCRIRSCRKEKPAAATIHSGRMQLALWQQDFGEG